MCFFLCSYGFLLSHLIHILIGKTKATQSRHTVDADMCWMTSDMGSFSVYSFKNGDGRQMRHGTTKYVTYGNNRKTIVLG